MNKKLIPYILLIIVMLGFLIRYVAIQNYEFIFYIFVLAVIVAVVYMFDKKLKFSALGIWSFTVWALLHLCGGGVWIGTTRLYDLILIPIVGLPYEILKYDQFVHFYCYVVVGLLLWEIASRYYKKNHGFLTFVLIAAALGIGGLNEIIEFSAVVFLGSAGPGGYYNTALDLVFNLVGAIAGVYLGRWRK